MKALFVHVPRCGGMSFYYFLEEIFGKENCIRFGDNTEVTEFLNSSDDYSKFACLSGHVPYPFFHDRACHKNRFVVAFVRNPELREFSCFSHMKGNDYIDHLNIPKDDQADYWSFFSNQPDLHNVQSSYFSNEKTSSSALGSILENRLCVFDVSDIYVVADIIKSFAGLNYMPTHINESNRKEQDLIELGSNSIKTYCAEDEKLHNWVKENRQFFLDQLKVEIWRNYLENLVKA